MKERPAASDLDALHSPEIPRPASYMRFTVRNDRSDESVSTLPPPPFENETDVPGLEWWLEAHMSLAGGHLCVEQALTGADFSASAIADALESLRDALYEMYCDAADPRMTDIVAPEAAVGRQVRAIYAVAEDVVRFILDGERSSELARELARRLETIPSVPVDTWIGKLDLDAQNPLEPLRNLRADVVALTAAVAHLARSVMTVSSARELVTA